MVFYVDATDETMTARLLKRGESSGRVDDNEDTIRKRLQTFHKHTKPVVEYYEKEGKLHRISSENQPDKVFAEIQKILDKEEFNFNQGY